MRRIGKGGGWLAAGLVWATTLSAQPAPEDAVARLVRELEAGAHPGIDAFLLHVGGETRGRYVSSKVPPGGLDLRSATKSITALLVGIALDRGELPGLETPVHSLLPEYGKQLGDDPRKAKITLRDLLTMRSGLDCDDWNPKSKGHEDKMYKKDDWLAFWASRPMKATPGTLFSYCTGNVIALGRILRDTTGESVDRYAEKLLFGPLGISGAKWEYWNRGRDVDSGGHLRLHPDELAKLGELVLERGQFRGQRVVSEAWIERLTHEHTAIPNQGQRYGFLWWLDAASGPRLPGARLWMASGNGGTFLVVMPELRAVVVFVGSRYNQPDALEPLAWLGQRILPTLKAH